MNRAVLFFLALLVAGILPSSLSAADLKCPTSVAVRQELQATPAGWEAVGGSSDVQLDRVAFYLKHPNIGGSLVPDATERSKGEERESWKFVSAPGDKFWMGCIYHDTTVILARELDTGVSKCEVRYELLRSGSRLRVKQISCE
jgi:hypothetical protein